MSSKTVLDSYVDMDVFLNTKQVAEILKVSVAFLEKGRSLKSAGHPPYFKVGGMVRYSKKALQKWLDSQILSIVNENQTGE